MQNTSLTPSVASSSTKSHLWIHVGLITFTLITIYPVLWVLALAFSGQQSVAIIDLPKDPGFIERLRGVIPWPAHFSVKNFTDVMTEQPFGRWLLNSVLVSVMTTVLGVFMACTAAYAFSRFKFAGRDAGMLAFLVSQMFPGTLMLIPLFIIIVKWLGLGNTFWGLVIVYATTAIPFCVWMLKGYFDTIPIDIEESARIDGASPGVIFFRIILPLAKPAIAITALFSFMTAWNEFILASVFLESELKYTAPVGLRFFVGGFSSQWGFFAAGSVIVSVPVVVLFLYLQKYLVGGLTAGSVK
jgi:arabinogalactan oligomer / maltooligosaccharide transport system permease protein